jgi:hypothetical protein
MTIKKDQIKLDGAPALDNEQRFDRIAISPSVIKTDEGFLRLSQMRATRTGVFKYMKADGTIRRELRHPDDVFKADSLETLKGKPITLLHPKDNGGFVTSKNFNRLSVGLTGSDIVVSENKFIDIDGSITKDSAVAELERRKANGISQELSCGYRADMIEESGVYEGEPYDVRQVNIRHNHLALVPKGRAGEACKVRLDSNAAVLFDNDIILENEMDKIILDGETFEVSPEIAKAFLKHTAKHDAAILDANKLVASAEVKADEATKELTTSKEDLAKSEAKADSLETELATTKEELKLDAAKLDALAEERSNVIEVANRYVKDFKKDGKEISEIKKETVLATGVNLDEKCEVYIAARFDMLAEAKEDKKDDKLKNQVNKTIKKDGDDLTNSDKSPSEIAREKMIADSRMAYTTKLTATI